MPSLSLFDQVVASSGLASIIAAPALRRALARAGVDSEALTPRDLARSLDAIEQSLRVYLPSDGVQQTLSTLRELAGVPDDEGR